MLSPIDYPYVFLDMEGSRSGERHDEDATYVERMISVFGLKVSSLFIYNIDVREVGHNTHILEIANMILHFLIVGEEHKRILFCVRDVTIKHNILNIRSKIQKSFEDALRDATNLYEHQRRGGKPLISSYI
jgi:hypothetical protein